MVDLLLLSQEPESRELLSGQMLHAQIMINHPQPFLTFNSHFLSFSSCFASSLLGLLTWLVILALGLTRLIL